jgi:hypothetical protein
MVETSLASIEHANRPQAAFECLSVGVVTVSQRLESLFADGIGWHQPESYNLIGMHKFFGSYTYGVTSHQCFTAASGHTQAGVWKAWQPGDRDIRNALFIYLPSSVVESGISVAEGSAGVEIGRENIQRTLLVSLELHG